MKKNVHPLYHPQAKITCACGNTFTVGSTKPEIHIEVCSACHPFYTGKQKFVDVAGRVERFASRLELTKNLQTSIKKRGKKTSSKGDEAASKKSRQRIH